MSPRDDVRASATAKDGPREFLGQLRGLMAGPSDEQRAHAERQRRQLLADLEEQVR